ncbi:MAG: hypothetical protein V4633_13370 [Pseudomonadota bacterium]
MNAAQFTVKAYSHDGVLLNVSGERDEDECVITRVTAADSQIDISDIFPINVLCRMADQIDAQLSRDARNENAVARAERHQWAREFAIA